MAAFVLLFALTIMVPPLLLLLAISRRLQRRHTREESGRALWIAAGAAVLVAAFQAAVAVELLIQGFRGVVDLGVHHAVALLLSWICLWLRVGMHHLRRMKSRRSY